MPKVPHKSEKSLDSNDDYEIVRFEDLCAKSPSSKTDLLALDDYNHQIFSNENDKASKSLDKGQPSPRISGPSVKTSLQRPKKYSDSHPRFGKNGSIARNASREQRYEFCDQGNTDYLSRSWGDLTSPLSATCYAACLVGPMLFLIIFVPALEPKTAQMGDLHLNKPDEQAHITTTKKPPSTMLKEQNIPSEHHRHDHSNLSTKNRNALELRRGNKEAVPERCAGAGLPDAARFDCLPQWGADQQECEKRGCCWAPTATKGAPFCYYPPQYQLYRFANMTENKHGLTVNYDVVDSSGYPDDFAPTIHFNYISDSVLQIKIMDASRRRFEVPYPEIASVPSTVSPRKYRVVVDSKGVGFKVVRTMDNVTIMNTQDAGAMILSDKFLQLSTLLPTDRLFGIGERRGQLLVDMNWKTYTIFNRDRMPIDNENLYGSHPFHLGVEKDGQSHGLLLLNSNAMDIVVQPTPAVTYRSVGGILNLYLLLAESPRGVVAQYSALVGRPAMPPYWALGFHLCKYNQSDVNVTRNVWKTNREANIPFDVQWNDIDYMERRNMFTLDRDRFAQLPRLVADIHAAGMHYVILMDPGIGASEKRGSYEAYERGLEMNVFIKNSTDQPFVGKVWNDGSTVWPDFTHPNSSAYWLEMMSKFHKLVQFDGAWIDMNEPSNFVSGPLHGSCAPESLPYRPRALDTLKDHTLCMEARHYLGSHFNWHSLYAYTEAVATHFALAEIRGTRPLIISRASWPGLGRYAGHWSGDIRSTWDDMRASIPEMLSFSLFGVPLMGADICGFQGDTTPRLCARWMQLGAFYPFSRNHNSDHSIPQDPVSLGPAVVAASKAALRVRYRLLPVIYTLFWRAHLYGETVATPVFFQAPHIQELHSIDTHFTLGDSLLISPALTPGGRVVALFSRLPAQRWYLLRGDPVEHYRFLSNTDTVAVKGGSILPVQEPPATGPVTTTVCRSSPFQILVAPSKDGDAKGELYWDDGDSMNTYEEGKYSLIEFHSNSTELRSVVKWCGLGIPYVDQIQVFGQPPISTVTLDGRPVRFTYRAKIQVMIISNINLSLNKPFTVKWVHKK